MSEHGTLLDTYVAALQHDLVDLSPDTLLVGVVRRPTPWFHTSVDENRPALGPPEELLDSFHDRTTTLQERGVSEADAHDRAWDDVDFDRRYREYLDDAPQAQAAIEQLDAELRGGRDVALVCYENTDEKRCHRTALRDYVDSGI